MQPEIIEIKSLKHDGSFHRSWDRNIVLKHTDEKLIGVNEHALVTESQGKQWRTKEPAVFYFPTDQWFNVIGLVKPDGIYYYCNISSPFVLRNNTLTYVDYDIDIIVTPSFSYELVDEAEYLYRQKTMNYPKHIKQQVSLAIEMLKNGISHKIEPFKHTFIDHWYHEFKNKQI